MDAAASNGVVPATDPPNAVRVSGGRVSIEEMIADCKNGVFVNRVGHISRTDILSGTITGVTMGACLLIRGGQIIKSIKNMRFVVSPWHFFDQVIAIGPTARAPFGYAPWTGSWPVAPTVVPPLMVRDFNFTALADAT